MLNFTPARSLAKIQFDDALTRVNDFYWGQEVAATFATEPAQEPHLATFIGSGAHYLTHRRLRTKARSIVKTAQAALPSFAVVLAFSYLEPYLRAVCLSAILSSPGLAAKPAVTIDGEHKDLADNPNLQAAIIALASPRVEELLKGQYAERLGKVKKFFDLATVFDQAQTKTLDEYYSKRNCIVHNDGIIDQKAKKHFLADARNVVGGRVVVEHTDFVALHSTMRDVSRKVDEVMLHKVIRNAEVIREVYSFMRANPNSNGKAIGAHLRRLQLGTISRNEIARYFSVKAT